MHLTGLCSTHVHLSREGAHTALGVVTGCVGVKPAGRAWSRRRGLPQGPVSQNWLGRGLIPDGSEPRNLVLNCDVVGLPIALLQVIGTS